MDLAVSVPPSLEVVGETNTGNIELAVRIRLALRIKDTYGVVAVVSLDGRPAPTASDVLEDYLATCKDACDGEIQRLYSRVSVGRAASTT